MELTDIKELYRNREEYIGQRHWEVMMRNEKYYEMIKFRIAFIVY